MKLFEMPFLALVEKMKEVKYRVSLTVYTLEHKFDTALEKYKKNNEMDNLREVMRFKIKIILPWHVSFAVKVAAGQVAKHFP